MSGSDYSEGAGEERPAAAGTEDGDLDQEAGAGALTIAARGAQGERVDRFLAKALAGKIEGVSRARIQRWIALGAVSCEQRQITASTRLSGFESLIVQPLPREADRAFEADPI